MPPRDRAPEEDPQPDARAAERLPPRAHGRARAAQASGARAPAPAPAPAAPAAAAPVPRKRPHDGAGGGGALTKSARAGDGAGGAGMVPGGTRLPRGQGVGVGEQLNFVLRCHPNEASVGRLTREYLRTSSELKVSQLKKFLGLKPSGTAAGALEILVHDPDEDRAVILHNQLSPRTCTVTFGIKKTR